MSFCVWLHLTRFEDFFFVFFGVLFSSSSVVLFCLCLTRFIGLHFFVFLANGMFSPSSISDSIVCLFFSCFRCLSLFWSSLVSTFSSSEFCSSISPLLCVNRRPHNLAV
uniref:Uncharacterized protein n=1 Tax=Cacopsylla melanoneura TaxID=428564 RepID=A0A8D8YGI5_9HEMI